ncbi:hypothetical protein CLM62_36245 [Streptomyces sp. SA15]|uniref:DUF3048 domain-containing protein n=1 Tax=Streptomyces sp. SA15 TaxID=934019 RepID=UPI000BAEF5B2|nr:DUF3048 domain-containing protein [Streptomyces sp. SA15]PAZ11205.1 hypothetical protein CLM62_36245 [Streptomyces sp. SA15]
MGRKARRQRTTTTVALLAASVTAALAAGCTGSGGPADDGRGQSRMPAAAQNLAGPTSRAGSVLAVKIDNVREARPQAGLNSADVVYVEQVEGGLSRLMAVYATQLPEVVGPVRSARESDLELLRQFERPTLAFSGAHSKLIPLINKAPLDAQTPGKSADAFFRDSGRASPHNLFLRPNKLLSSAPGEDALTTGFRYGAAPEGGQRETSRTVRYPAAQFTFTWSADQGRWLVSQDGTPTVTTDGKRAAPATVVVQHVKIRQSEFRDVVGSNSPYTETVGSGKAEVLRDGRAHDARWEREKATDGTEFTTNDGAPVNFARGQVWVVFVKA